jgi:hypothetical protein
MRQVLMMGPTASIEASAWGLAWRMIPRLLANLELPARLRPRYYRAGGVVWRVPRGVSGSRG